MFSCFPIIEINIWFPWGPLRNIWKINNFLVTSWFLLVSFHLTICSKIFKLWDLHPLLGLDNWPQVLPLDVNDDTISKAWNTWILYQNNTRQGVVNLGFNIKDMLWKLFFHTFLKKKGKMSKHHKFPFWCWNQAKPS